MTVIAREPMSFPDSAWHFTTATWNDVLPYYRALDDTALTSSTVDTWLRTWSALEELVTEAQSLLMIAYTADVSDAAAEAAYTHFISTVAPAAADFHVRLAAKLLDSKLGISNLHTPLRRFRAEVSLHRPENTPRLAILDRLATSYQKLMGKLVIELDGVSHTISDLKPFMYSPDRRVRERTFRAEAAACLTARPMLCALFDEMLRIRNEVAESAGSDNYRDYVFAARFRFDYSADDCARFHDAVESVVVPALARVFADRRARLGIAALRPWDLKTDPNGTATEAPFRNTRELLDRAKVLFTGMDDDLGTWFRLVLERGLVDAASASTKAAGAYCADLAHQRLPFISMQASGAQSDVRTLVHEAGHAFHVLAARRLPLIWQRQVDLEAAELASTTLELLVAPHVSGPAQFYSPESAARIHANQLEEVLVKLAHIASVDAFQSWMYTHPDGSDADARDAKWREIRRRFEPEVDWTGLESEETVRWYRQLHIFQFPFYYIEYGIAQLGALQIWQQSLTDPRSALRHYKRALALGGSVALPEMYNTAGASLVFDPDRMAPLIDKVENTLAALRG